jgi:hypothetical protein
MPLPRSTRQQLVWYCWLAFLPFLGGILLPMNHRFTARTMLVAFFKASA